MAYLGKSPSQGVRNRYYFTASGGETSISGALTGGTLTFTDGNYVDVNLNGVTLVAGTDYNTSTANTIAGLSALTASDVVEIVVYDVFSVFSGNVNSDFSVGGNLSVTGTTAFTGATTITGLTTTGDISFGDNDKAIFGAGSDLQVYHSGTHSWINENGTGNLYIQSSGAAINVTNGSSRNLAQFNTSTGTATLFYDNGTSSSAKLATTATGVDVTGVITTDGMTTSADINFGDSDKAVFGAGSDLQIYHDGSNSFIDDAGTGNVFLRGSSQVIIGNMTGEQAAVFNDNGAVTINYDNAQKLATTSYGIDISGSVVADTQTAGAITSSQTPDFDTYQNFVWTFTGNVTLANPTTEKTGQSGFFIFIQDGTGNHTLSLGTDYETAGGAGITLSTAASAVDVVPYIVQSSGNILLGAPQLAFS